MEWNVLSKEMAAALEGYAVFCEKGGGQQRKSGRAGRHL